jgi:endoglucanase
MAANVPQNMPSVWEKHWSFLQKAGTAPILVGEFGGRSMGQDTGGVWQRSLLAYMKTNNISYTYWSWNPDSGDTGGILQDNWKTINKSKLDILNAYQWPMLGKPASGMNKNSKSADAIANAYQLSQSN